MASIFLVLLILALAVLLLVTEWIPLEATALLVLATLALTGLLSVDDALSGFSNPAVVTVWAVFILSAGLTRTGVASLLGRHVLRWAGTDEPRQIAVVMLSAGSLSAFMNNVAVAALMLPVVMNLARRTRTPPSRLLMPLAYGSLLGGLTTMIGTPPNVLVSNALRDANLTPFQIFDFTPAGVAVMVAGVAYMVFFGSRGLPSRDLREESAAAGHLNLREQYDLGERMFLLRVPPDSVFAGKPLLATRLGSALGLHVAGILRGQSDQLAPSPLVTLQAGDRLLVEGTLERVHELAGWRQLQLASHAPDTQKLLAGSLAAAEMRISPRSPLVGKTLRETAFQKQRQVEVLALRREGEPEPADPSSLPLKADDLLLCHGRRSSLQTLRDLGDFADLAWVEAADLAGRLEGHLFALRVPKHSSLPGQTLGKAALGETLSISALAIERQDGSVVAPGPDQVLLAGDTIIAKGKIEDLHILQGLEHLEIQHEVDRLESESVGLAEAVLSPRTNLAGKSLQELRFRERYGVSVLAIWREGRPHRTGLAEMVLQLGDALLLYGPRKSLHLLGTEPDFIFLSGAAAEPPRLEKSKLSLLIMAAILLPVLLGLAPLAIMAVAGAALMVVTRCLTMPEAYRAIEWRAVFLIAGMLPLGLALEQSGAAAWIADAVIALTGPFGPHAVMAGLLALTFLAACAIPPAAIVVLMAPIVLNASAGLAISPYPMMLGLALAASSSFISPIAHPANLLVMGPGGYRFADYIKAGLPLTLVVFLVILLLVPLLWPFAS